MFRAIKFFQALLISSALLLSLSAVADSQPMGPGGGDHPWPWGLEMPFPWDNIQGIWRMDERGKSFYFSFRRLQGKRLLINEFDIDACVIRATGPGLERAKTVVAQMSEFGSQSVYRMTLYAFDPKDTPAAHKFGGDIDPEHVMVARVIPLNMSGQEVASQMVKITPRLEIHCAAKNKFLKF